MVGSIIWYLLLLGFLHIGSGILKDMNVFEDISRCLIWTRIFGILVCNIGILKALIYPGIMSVFYQVQDWYIVCTQTFGYTDMKYKYLFTQIYGYTVMRYRCILKSQSQDYNVV